MDAVDGHAGHADVALHPRMVGIVAAVGRQIEGDRQPLLTGGEVAAVEGIGCLGGREAGILADGPGVAGIHGRIGAAHIGGDARQAVDEVEPLDGVGTIGGLDGQALGRVPGAACGTGAGRAEVELDL